MLYWASPQYRRIPHSTQISYLKKLLDRAIELAPDNPTHRDRLAQLYLWELATQKVDESRRRVLHDEGLAAARFSVAHLPGWALSWVRLLVFKSEFNELDNEFRVALERATTLGKWQANIHTAVLRATLPVWDGLNDTQRELALDAGVRGLRQGRSSTVAVLKEYDRLTDVCQRLPPGDPLRGGKECARN